MKRKRCYPLIKDEFLSFTYVGIWKNIAIYPQKAFIEAFKSG